jgi:hypothetical protein
MAASFKAKDSRFRRLIVSGLRFRLQGLRIRVSGCGFRVQAGKKKYGFRFRG